ncbi:MAG: dihydrolipoyllysine-residue succinyltransferase component of 2-oxoglutarate dehydrogenase complex [Armatimonadota bacterium]|nr:MAG: dihydrolipoyllysine-residue succinyltransferase component of 2-oxoglutarate dehydrogenase complex [Armatimonadota bacterium]
MPLEIRVPMLAESVLEATVGRWLKREGDRVSVGEPLVELETDKVNAEVPADAGGVLHQILRREGEVVRPGEVLGLLNEVEETATTAPSPAPEKEEEGRATPIARKMAEELGIDLRELRGTGPGGRVTKEDVQAAARWKQQVEESLRERVAEPAPPSHSEEPSAAPALAAPTAPRAETRQRLSRRRLTIARRLVEAQHTAAMLTTFNEIDMSAVMALRAKWKERFQQQYGVTLGFMPFFVKAVIGALREFPQLNAELQGDELVLKHYYDIGIAIGDPEGLVVPVLRDADKMNFAQIEKAIAQFVEKARNHTLTLEELQGGTFTITNGGVFGSLLSTPILNPPQVGILGMHRIQERPVVVEGQIVIRPMMYVALSYDHRVVDGREAVLFLVRVKQLVEDPERLLLEG